MAQAAEEEVSDYQAPVTCGQCDAVKGVNSYCVDCKNDICDTCKSHRLHRTHRILPRTDPEATKARRTARFPCKSHPDKEYDTFCKTCQEPCCAKCIPGAHDIHSFADIDSVSREVKEELTSTLSIMTKNMLPALVESSKSLKDSMMEEYNESVDKSVAVCETTFESFRGDITKLENEWKVNIRKVQDKENSIVCKDRNKLDLQIDQIKKAIYNCKTKLHDASNLSLLTLRSDCRKNVEIEPYKITVPTS